MTLQQQLAHNLMCTLHFSGGIPPSTKNCYSYYLLFDLCLKFVLTWIQPSVVADKLAIQIGSLCNRD